MCICLVDIQLPRDSFLPAVTGVEDDTIINVVGNVNSKRKVAGNPKKVLVVHV
jgi:hypothetical protein